MQLGTMVKASTTAWMVTIYRVIAAEINYKTVLCDAVHTDQFDITLPPLQKSVISQGKYSK